MNWIKQSRIEFFKCRLIYLIFSNRLRIIMLTFFLHFYALQALSTTHLYSAARAAAWTAGVGTTYRTAVGHIFDVIITNSSASFTSATVHFRTFDPFSVAAFCYASCYRQYNKNLHNIDTNFAFGVASLTEGHLKIPTKSTETNFFTC